MLVDQSRLVRAFWVGISVFAVVLAMVAVMPTGVSAGERSEEVFGVEATSLSLPDYEELLQDSSGDQIIFTFEYVFINLPIYTQVSPDDRYVTHRLLIDGGKLAQPHPDIACLQGCVDFVVYDRNTGELDPLFGEVNAQLGPLSAFDASTFDITPDLNTFVGKAYCYPGDSFNGVTCAAITGEVILFLHTRDTDQTTVLYRTAKNIPPAFLPLFISDDASTVVTSSGPGSEKKLDGVPDQGCLFEYICSSEDERLYMWESGYGWSMISPVGAFWRLEPGGEVVDLAYCEEDDFETPEQDCYIGEIDLRSRTLSRVLLPVFPSRTTPWWVESVGDRVIFWLEYFDIDDKPHKELWKLDKATNVMSLLRADCRPFVGPFASALSVDGEYAVCQDFILIGEKASVRVVDWETGETTSIFTPEEGFDRSGMGVAIAIGSRLVTQLTSHANSPDNYILYAWTGTPDGDPGTGGGSSKGTFSDDDSSIFEADIEWLAAQGITRGCNPPANDLFCPNDFVTRGQMAAFLHRALDDALEPGAPVEFTDDNGSTFEADIEWLGATGVTRGCNPPANTEFCPNDNVTRGQMAAFLHRALGPFLDTGETTDFIDDNGSTFEADIEWLGATGVTRGCNPPTNDRFCPGGLVTRGQMAAFLHRALGD